MIRRGLAVALAAGMLGGLATALALADLRHDRGAESADGAPLSLLTDAADYGRGEPVTVRVINSGGEALRFCGPAHGLRVTGLAGMPIFSSPLPGGGEPGACMALDPGEEHSVVWDQAGDDGEQVFDGVYRVTVAGAGPGGGRVEQSATVSVHGPDLTFGS